MSADWMLNIINFATIDMYGLFIYTNIDNLFFDSLGKLISIYDSISVVSYKQAAIGAGSGW